MISLVLSLSFLLPPASLPACPSAPPHYQDKMELRKEFQRRFEAINPGEARAFFLLGLWAKRKGLKLEAVRAFQKVIKIDPDHGKARALLGFVKYGDKWVKEREYERIKKKGEEAEYKKKGWVKVHGEWVPPEDAGLAKLGFHRLEGKWVRDSDRELEKQGKVRHPQTGEWMDRKDLEKAEKGLFPVAGRWLSLEKADGIRKNWENPWVLVGDDIILVTDYGFDKANTILTEAETALVYAKKLIFRDSMPLPLRFRIFAYSNREDYRSFAVGLDQTGSSAYGCYFSPGRGKEGVHVFYGEAQWGPYYLRHAAGMGASLALLGSPALPMTHWFHTGVGSFCERWSNPKHAKHFGGQYEAKGGVKRVASFMDSFRISGDLSTEKLQWTVYQAGFLLYYTKNVENKKVRTAFETFKNTCLLARGSGKWSRKLGKKIKKATTVFEKALERASGDMKACLDKILKG